MTFPPYSATPAYPSFMAADAYRRWRVPQAENLLHEPCADFQTAQAAPCHRWGNVFGGTERHLQAIWADATLRPTLIPFDGGTLRILNPGKWNGEGGPDFRSAVLQIEPSGKILRGDVEIHIRPSDWTAHRHADNPSYSNIIAHVTWFPGTPPATLPPGTLSIALRAACELNQSFSLDDIDVSSYPYAVFSVNPTPCSQRFANTVEALDLLAAAGSYRIQLKARRICRQLQSAEKDAHVLYEACLAALGYKHHAAAFRLIARTIKPLPQETREAFYARLLGAADLFPAEAKATADPETQAALDTLKTLWNKSGETPVVSVKTHGSSRPQNAPWRRLAAAAALFSDGGSFMLELFNTIPCQTGAWYGQVADFLERTSAWDFWERRLSLTGTPGKPVKLLGKGRIGALITNAIVPFFIAENILPEALLVQLPPEDLSDPQHEMAARLFGANHSPDLYARSGLLQQGLLQLIGDHCRVHDTCADCPLGERESKK